MVSELVKRAVALRLGGRCMVSELVKRAVALRLGVRQLEFSYAFCSKVVPAATLAAAAAGAAAAAAAVAAAAAGAIFYFTGISEGTLGSFRCMVSELVKRAVALRLSVRKPEFSYAFCSKVVPAATLAAAAGAAAVAAAAGTIFYFNRISEGAVGSFRCMVSELVKRAVALRLGVRKPKCSYAFCSNVAPAATLAAAAGAAAAAAAVAAAAAGAIFYFNGISEGTLGSFRCMVSELVKRAVALRLSVRKPEFSYAFCSNVVPAATVAAAAGAATLAAAVAAAAAGTIFYFNGSSEGTLGSFRCMVSELVKRAVALRLGVRKPKFFSCFCSKVVPAATLAAAPGAAAAAAAVAAAAARAIYYFNGISEGTLGNFRCMVSELVKRAVALRLGVRKLECSYPFCSKVVPAATLAAAAAAAGAAAAAAAIAAAAARAIFYFNGISEGALGSFRCMVSELVKRGVALCVWASEKRRTSSSSSSNSSSKRRSRTAGAARSELLSRNRE